MANEQLKTLKSRRGQLKAQLTRFTKFIDDESNHGKVTELNARIQNLESSFNKFDDIQDQIELLDVSTDQELERSEFENTYFAEIAKAKELVNNFNSNNSLESLVSNNANTHVKLPQLRIPEFHGNYDKWMQFYDTFRTLIHENGTLTDIQKYYYLQSSLKGDAARVISSLEISDTNYNTAWTLLKERFENRKFIIKCHVKHIFDLPPVVKESYSSLRTFLDNFLNHYRALKNLDEPVESWSTLLIYLLCSKLDISNKREWEIKSQNEKSPNTDCFVKFLTERVALLESIDKGTNSSAKIHVHIASLDKCMYCNEHHKIFACKKFLQQTVTARYKIIRDLKACINCLRKGHLAANCNSSKCKTCGQKHNTLLHLAHDNSKTRSTGCNSKIETPEHNRAASSEEETMADSNVIVTHTRNLGLTILSTATVDIVDDSNTTIKCRALLDSGSQSNFITYDLFKKLNLPTNTIHLPVTGINSQTTYIDKVVQAKIRSTDHKHQFNLSLLVISKITDNVPQQDIQLDIPSDIHLADPTFYKQGDIDILLGANIFYELLLPNQIKLGINKPVLQKTKLGWIVGGSINETSHIQGVTCNLTCKGLQNQLQSFWQIEEDFAREVIYSKEELNCERHFCENFSRDSITGHFTVKLPFRDKLHELGHSLDMAIKRFTSIERKFARDHNFKHQYVNFMEEYQALGHMTAIDESEQNESLYYLPHHAVFKDTSATTKMRVVFDASSKPDDGLSLNSVLQTGPVIQDDIFSIMLRFRTHSIVFTADIAKMYRCIQMHPDHQHYQRIVWRLDNSQPLQHFKLNTVTYGTNPASFLATRCLKQLALESQQSFPEASRVIAQDFYMDDLISGTETPDEAIQMITEINDILRPAGFYLRQWASNQTEILDTPTLDQNTQYILRDLQHSSKTLGLIWYSAKDCFAYQTNNPMQPTLTKRNVLSIISQIYDPLGLIGPVITKAKLILQLLWKSKIDWDQELSPELLSVWYKFYKNIHLLNELKIPRQAIISNRNIIDIHVFSDASEKAYGTCLFIRSAGSLQEVQVKLVCSKSRVAPLKVLSLPRLELCGAVLAIQLCKKVLNAFKCKINSITYWCDSTIVLAWISTDASRLKTFVSNRVSKIQSFSRPSQWRYLPSNENPADVISRGLNPEQINDCTLWFEGPTWLTLEPNFWPTTNSAVFKADGMPELKPPQVLASTVAGAENKHYLNEIINKYSSYMKLLRVISYVLRFKNNTRLNVEHRQFEFITNNELEASLKVIVKCIQQAYFQNEIHNLKLSLPVAKNSKLISLDPFIDSDGIIRVGGRLENTYLEFDNKHPMILPERHHFIDLIVRYEHHRNLHAGTQAILGKLRMKFWPLNAKRTIRRVLRSCVTCFRANPSSHTQKMGNLPLARVTPTAPFTTCGVDYAGPFSMKDSTLRNQKIIKAYVCIFICFATKAVHIELVTSLTIDSFLLALKRFIGRRGLCRDIYSDNATNFVGANKRLIREFDDLVKNEVIKHYFLENRITWHFIPPRSPHMGGLWEAAVRRTKYHLTRVLNNVSLTYEQFYTLLVQIESILNSRPLYPLTDDPKDYTVLTPGHFIIGGESRAVPELPVESRSSLVSRYKHVQLLMQHFWHHWSRDYLHTLQQRTKWKTAASLCKPLEGTLVILKEDHLPPMLWKMGRITKVFPGTDGIIRVVEIKTCSSTFRRAVNKICILPLEERGEETEKKLR